ncbi:MAG: DUF4397 domain-containing protein [Saprospiraceae bacterium]|nr:DUF4397 domain-containing protein [Saprospiraceae bacterium]
MYLHRLFSLPVALLAASALFFTSCDEDDAEDISRVKVIHASPDAPAVDILIDDARVNDAPLAFPANTGYLDVLAGNRNLKVNAAGTTTTVINGNVVLEKDKAYSVFAIDILSKIEPLILVDDLASPASGKAHIRFAHLSPDAPAVDIALAGGAVVFPNVPFKSATGFLPVDGGNYNFEVRVAGTTTVALSLPGIQLQPGKIYTVFAKGFLAPPSGNANVLGAQLIQHN